MKHLAVPLLLLIAACDTQFATKDANVRTTFNFTGLKRLWDAKVQQRIALELELLDPATTPERRQVIETTIAVERRMLNDVITQAIVTLSTSYTIEITAPNLVPPQVPNISAAAPSQVTTHPGARK